MNSYDSMKSKLRPLGLYSLGEDGAVCRELRAFASGLDGLFGEIAELEREGFLQTAESYGLTEREKTAGRIHPELSVEQRRERLINEEKCDTRLCTPQSLVNAIKALGIESVTLTENTSPIRFTVRISDSLSEAECSRITAKIAKMSPAHLVHGIVFGSQ